MNQAGSLALERISILIRMCKKYPEYAKRYAYLARKLGEKAGIPLPRDFKRQVCKNCGAYLVQGRNCATRLKNKVRYVTCKECGKVRRYSYAVRRHTSS